MFFYHHRASSLSGLGKLLKGTSDVFEMEEGIAHYKISRENILAKCFVKKKCAVVAATIMWFF